MKTLKRTKLTSALLAASTGLSMLALGSSANADILEEELQQDVLIFPYYTVRDGWTTLANVSNTSPFTIVVKARYRESYNSRDVLDFNIVLSPFDVWTGWVAEGPNGPRLHTRDNSCTTPIFQDAGDGSRYADFSTLGYQEDGGPKDIDRTREGHFEFLTMAQFFPGAEDKTRSSDGSESNWGDNNVTITWKKGDGTYPTAYYAKHEDGKPRDCTIVDSRFEATIPQPSTSKILSGDFDSDGDPLAEWDADRAIDNWPHDKFDEADEPLKGNFSLVNVGKGIAAGGFAHVPDDDFCDWDSTDGNDGDYGHLITAQQFPWFLEPTLYSRCESSPDSDVYPGLWGWNREYSEDMDIAAANNEWSFNDKTGAATDWVVTFPTKEFHVDVSSSDVYAAASSARMIKNGACNDDQGGDEPWECTLWNNNNPWDLGTQTGKTFEEAFLKAGGLYFHEYNCNEPGCSYAGFEETFGEEADGQSCDTVVYNLWDREEEGVQGSGTSISPAPPQPVDSLCYESNVLAFQDESALSSDLAVEIDTSVIPSGAKSGLLKLQFGTGCSFSSNKGSNGEDFCPSDAELPAIGFMFKSRDFGDPMRNFGVISKHGADD